MFTRDNKGRFCKKRINQPTTKSFYVKSYIDQQFDLVLMKVVDIKKRLDILERKAKR